MVTHCRKVYIASFENRLECSIFICVGIHKDLFFANKGIIFYIVINI